LHSYGIMKEMQTYYLFWTTSSCFLGRQQNWYR